MAEDKRAIQKDRDRLERIVKSGAASLASEGSSQVCRLRFCKLSSPVQSSQGASTCTCAGDGMQRYSDLGAGYARQASAEMCER